MSRLTKQQKFLELSTMPNVLQKPTGIAGHWQTRFAQCQPLIIELGCGYGEYTIALAQRYPDKNYIGIDIQGERLWHGAQESLKLNLPNVLWLRAPIDHLTDYFAPAEITALWLTFPDPFPKSRAAKKRLTSPTFLKMYQTSLIPNGKVHLKTDVHALINYTQETIKHSGAQLDIFFENVVIEETAYDLDIRTWFEQKHRALGELIYYLSWHWPKQS